MKTVGKTEYLSIPEAEKLLEECADDESRVDLLNKLAAIVVKSDISRAEQIGTDACELAEKLGYLNGKAVACYELGDIARTADEYRRALNNYSTALECFQTLGNSIQEGRCFRRLGDVHFYLNNLSLSLKYYLKALRIFEKAAESNDSSYARINLGHLMATIGNVLRASGDMEASLEYYNHCRLIYIEEGFSEGIPGILYNTGNVFSSQGKLDDALIIYHKALRKAEECGDTYLVSMALNSIGSVYLERDEFDTAEDCFRKSMNSARKQGRNRGILAATLKLVELGRCRDNLKEALDLSYEAEELAVQLDDRRSTMGVLKERTLIFKGMAEYEKALETMLAYEKFREELLSEKRVQELDVLRIRYETEVKEHKIELLRKKRAAQGRMISAALFGLAVTGVSLILAFRNVRFRTRVNKELAEAYSRVEKLSQIDTLTGLANRRSMMKSLSEEQTRSSRTGREFSLIMSDIDGFKQVNDCYGHGCGDEVLVEVARRLRKSLRNQDIISRWGGEEFLLLLPETTLKNAVRVAEKTRALIEGSPFTWHNISIHLTMTFGVSQGGSIPLDEAIQLADAALYRGKENGKNGVTSQ